MKKFMVLATILVAGLLFIPNVYAEYNGTDLGTVTENSGKDSVGDSDVSDVVDSTDQKNVVITYNALSLKVIAQTEGSQDRGKDAAWVGFHITTPSSAEISKAKFKVGNAATFDNNADTDGNYYFSITAEDLQKAIDSGTPIIKKISFSWDGKGNEDQTVTIIIDPAKVVLTAKDSTEIEFNGPEEKQKLDEQKVKETEAAAKEKEETNPNTSDTNLYLLLSLIALSGLGIAYTVKRRFN